MLLETPLCRKLCAMSVFYRHNIFTIAFHCKLMLVFGDGVLRLHHVVRGWREFNSWLAFIIMIAHFIPADKEHVNTVQVVEIVLENQQDTIWVLSIAVEWFVKNIPNIVGVNLGYSRVCEWWVPRCTKEFLKDWCREVLFHFFSHLKD